MTTKWDSFQFNGITTCDVVPQGYRRQEQKIQKLQTQEKEWKLQS